jgi:hypothetical protein
MPCSPVTVPRRASAAGALWTEQSSDEVEAEALFAARRLAYLAHERLGPVLTEDICVPRSAVPGMLAEVEEIGRRHGVQIATIAHAGDGNLHPLLIIPPGDDGARRASLRSTISSNVLRSTSARSRGGVADHTRSAAEAASIAAATSSTPARGTEQIAAPVDGFSTSKLPFDPSRHSPPMNCCVEGPAGRVTQTPPRRVPRVEAFLDKLVADHQRR